MSFQVYITEEYLIGRINNWDLNMSQNKIYGDIQPFGNSAWTRVSGRIESYIDKHVMARIDNRLYALVLGNINEEKEYKWREYITYLRNKTAKPVIII